MKIKPLATSGNIAYIISARRKKYLFRLAPFGFKWRSKQEIEAEIVTDKNGEQIIVWKNHFG